MPADIRRVLMPQALGLHHRRVQRFGPAVQVTLDLVNRGLQRRQSCLCGKPRVVHHRVEPLAQRTEPVGRVFDQIQERVSPLCGRMIVIYVT